MAALIEPPEAPPLPACWGGCGQEADDASGWCASCEAAERAGLLEQELDALPAAAAAFVCLTLGLGLLALAALVGGIS